MEEILHPPPQRPSGGKALASLGFFSFWDRYFTTNGTSLCLNDEKGSPHYSSLSQQDMDASFALLGFSFSTILCLIYPKFFTSSC